MSLAHGAKGRGEPPFPPIRRDIGRLFSNPLGTSLRSAPKSVPPLPLLTLEGCPKDGVVSPPSASPRSDTFHNLPYSLLLEAEKKRAEEEKKRIVLSIKI